MEQTAYRASEGAIKFQPPDSSLVARPDTMPQVGKGASSVRFLAEPQPLFDAISAKEPLPPVSNWHLPVLFASELPHLCRALSK